MNTRNIHQLIAFSLQLVQKSKDLRLPVKEGKPKEEVEVLRKELNNLYQNLTDARARILEDLSSPEDFTPGTSPKPV